MLTLNWKKSLFTIAAIQVGTGVTIIGVLSFIPLFLVEMGVNDSGEAAFWAGLISGVTPMMVSFSAPYWTRKAEHYGGRRILALILALITLVTFGCALTTQPWQLFILRMIQGLIGGFVPVCAAMTVAVTPKEKMTYGLGVFQAANVMGIMFGPVIGGVTADLFGYRMPFILFGTLALLSCLGALFLIPDIKSSKKPEGSVWKDIIYFLSNPTVRLMIFLQFLCNFAMTGIGPILPLYIRGMMGGDAKAVATIVGIIIFLAGGSSAMASLRVDRLTARHPMHKILISASATCGVLFILQYMMPNVWGLGFFRAMTGLFMGLIMPISNTIITLSVPDDKKGTVFGTTTSLALWGNVAGPVFSGALAMKFGYGSVFWSTAFIFFFVTLLIRLQHHKIVAAQEKNA
ncbi:MAG: MFS transporter [Allisonella histaminiformans]|uniref:MFS transporter n=1 Tax=Allisonella histaminiformans TaxID=209880 RepID=UPI002A7F43EC|nr:MFS transporter [Allisonella histaminiformans]MDY4540444.1 MFS transporter [Allisonella histaminiformans]